METRTVYLQSAVGTEVAIPVHGATTDEQASRYAISEADARYGDQGWMVRYVL